VVYTNNTFAQIIDPPDGSPEYARQAYDYHLGKMGTAGTGVPDRPDGSPYPSFWFSGDPVTGEGDLPANFPMGSFAPQDIRVMINTGPFTLAPGDSQEIVGAIVHAQGADRLSSVSLLKQVDRVAQQAFDDQFVVPNAPPLPNVVISELSNELVIDWSDGAKESEEYVFQNEVYDYRFEGYNLYQGESVNGPWLRLGTWDLVNDVTIIEDYVQNLEAGRSYLEPVQFGDDSDLQRFFVVREDYLDGTPLINGKEYYFALTTYAYNYVEGALDLGMVMALEFAKEAITVVPHGQPVGNYVPTETGEIVEHSRQYDDALIPEIVDPLQQTGTSYTVIPEGTGSLVTSWSVVRGTSDTVVNGNTNFAGDNSSPLVDGILFRLTKPASGVRRDNQPDPAGWLYLPEDNVWSDGAGTGFQSGGSSVTYPDGQTGITPWPNKTLVDSAQLKKVEIRFSGSQTQKAYRYLRNVPTFPPVPIADSSFLPYVNRKGPGLVYQRDYDQITVPFTAWEVDSLDGDPTPRQLNVAFIEDNQTPPDGAIDAQWGPTSASGGANEAIFVFASTYADTEASSYDVNLQTTTVDVYYIIHLRRDTTAATANWQDGDVITVTPNYALEAGRSFTLQTTAPVEGNAELASQEIGKINIVPNPYFGRNRAEVNQFNRFVTITHLPQVATIRVITITGELVRTLEKDDASSFYRWDLRNRNGLPVASGVYIIHIEIPDAGSRILKFAVIQPEERATRI
jgi:hypothetical protein